MDQNLQTLMSSGFLDPWKPLLIEVHQVFSKTVQTHEEILLKDILFKNLKILEIHYVAIFGKDGRKHMNKIRSNNLENLGYATISSWKHETIF